MVLVYCFLFYYFSLLAHELGHIFAARLAGWKPLAISLGCSRTYKIFRIGDMECRIGENPFGGRAHAVASDPAHFRLKQLIFVAGGPLVTIFLFFVLLILVVNPAWMENLPDAGQETTIGFLVVECMLLTGCVIPRDFRRGRKSFPNDAKLILRTLAMKENDVKAAYASHACHLSSFYLKEDRMSEAKSALMEAADFFGGRLNVSTFWIHSLLRAGKKPEAQAEIDGLLGGRSDSRAEALDAVACIPIYYGYREMIADALCYIDEALVEAPGMITLKGTKGSLLIEEGHLEEGVRLLDETLLTTNSANDKAICEYYLALALHRKGDLGQARNRLCATIGIAANCVVRQRIESEILRGENEATSSQGQSEDLMSLVLD